MQPLILFGGTFDPVHRGHVAVALDVARAFGAPVRLMPAAVPPHRGLPGVAAADRLRMLELAVAEHPELRIDDRELRRAGPSWTVETLRALRREEGAARPVIVLIGADAFGAFDTWRDWRAIPDLAHVVVLTRPGAGAPLSDALRAEIDPRRVDDIAALQDRPAGCVLELAVTPVPASSTEVRARIARAAEIDSLLPPPVAAYIAQRGLYR